MGAIAAAGKRAKTASISDVDADDAAGAIRVCLLELQYTRRKLAEEQQARARAETVALRAGELLKKMTPRTKEDARLGCVLLDMLVDGITVYEDVIAFDR